MIVYYSDYAYADEKDRWLRDVRGVSFPDLIDCIVYDGLVGGCEHPNQKKYPGQYIYEVEFAGYVYMIPAVRHGEVMFLKTAYPSRKATKRKARSKNEKT